MKYPTGENAAVCGSPLAPPPAQTNRRIANEGTSPWEPACGRQNRRDSRERPALLRRAGLHCPAPPRLSSRTPSTEPAVWRWRRRCRHAMSRPARLRPLAASESTRNARSPKQTTTAAVPSANRIPLSLSARPRFCQPTNFRCDDYAKEAQSGRGRETSKNSMDSY